VITGELMTIAAHHFNCACWTESRSSSGVQRVVGRERGRLLPVGDHPGADVFGQLDAALPGGWCAIDPAHRHHRRTGTGQHIGRGAEPPGAEPAGSPCSGAVTSRHT
jgi:hypothetical protein